MIIPLIRAAVVVRVLSTITSTLTSVPSTDTALSTANSASQTSTIVSISSAPSDTGSASLSHVTSAKPVASETIVNNGQAATRQSAAAATTNAVVVNGQSVNTNTSVVTTAQTPTNVTTNANTVGSTILIIARDSGSAYSAYSGLNGYGIPYQVLVVPQTGITLPQLNSSATTGNFGAIVVLSEVSYDYGTAGGGFQSALKSDQWTALYTYQTTFGVRMVRLDVFPSTDSGTLARGGCCAAGQEQLISFSTTKGFETAGLKTGATFSSLGLYHYPATITNTSIASPFLQFGPTTGFSGNSVGGVINHISGREQMVFFISFATDWSTTSTLLQHSWIHWVTRGLYAGFRRVNFGTQVDDMFLVSDIYSPAGLQFRVRTGDLTAIKNWIPTINKKMPAGSNYFMEIGHNGNGNIEQSDIADKTGKLCSGGPVEYGDQSDTPLEFQKPLGTGANIWPAKPVDYPYSVACTNKDPLRTWWTTPANRDAFAHVSHTFTHESENNATYYDIYNEISWNQAWLKQIGLDSATRFSANGLIPPAITGLHNGDALKAWSDRGIKNAVGDNTRPALLNADNEHWPLITTVAANGFNGIQITPRWATNIYYNCDSAACTVAEWIDTSAGQGNINDLLAVEKDSTSRHLFGLHHDPYMFHQANLRQTDVSTVTINGVTSKLSLIQMWTETVVQEFARLVTWPMITLKHDDISTSFANRMKLDACAPKMTYILDNKAKTVTGVTVSTNGNTCETLVPVTVPGTVKNTLGFTTEQIGSDPLTIWVKMGGAPVSFTLTTPLPW